MAKRTVAVVSRRTRAVVEHALLGGLEHDAVLLVAVERVDHVGDRRDALVGDALLEDAERAGVAEAERPSRSSSAAAPKSTGDAVRAQRHAGVADAGAGRHAGDVGDGEELGRRAVEPGAGRPDPDADRHGASAMRSSSSSISSSADDRARAVDLQDEGLGAVGAGARSASSMASTRIGSNRPAHLQHVDRSPAVAPASWAARLPRPGGGEHASASGARAGRSLVCAKVPPELSRSSAAADRRARGHRGGQGGRREDHGNGGSGPRGRRRRAARAGRRARRQAGARASLVGDLPCEAHLGAGGARRVPARPRLRAGRQAADGDAASSTSWPRRRPGIDDIVVLGKIKQLERSGDWDLIVVDGPAAGHAITFLTSAAGLLDAVRGGPVRTQADDVLELLHDPGAVPGRARHAAGDDAGQRARRDRRTRSRTGSACASARSSSTASTGLDGDPRVPDPDGVDLRRRRRTARCWPARPTFRRARRRMQDAEIERLGDSWPSSSAPAALPVAGLGAGRRSTDARRRRCGWRRRA